MSARAAPAAPFRRIAVGPLAATQVDQAFPLLHPLLPGIGVAAWQDFAGAVLRDPLPRRGILIAKETDACLLGLAAYEVTEDLRHGRVARVDPLTAADLVDPAIVAGALLRAVEIAAARCGCAAVAVRPLPRRSEMRRWLAATGYVDEAGLLCKRIPWLTPTEAVEMSSAMRSE